MENSSPAPPYLHLQQGTETSATHAAAFQLCDTQVCMRGQPLQSMLEMAPKHHTYNGGMAKLQKDS